MKDVWIKLFDLITSLSIEIDYKAVNTRREYIALAYCYSDSTAFKYKIEVFFIESDSEMSMLFTFAHEVGHILDFIRNGSPTDFDNQAREKFIAKEELNLEEKLSIMDAEQKAWNFGRDVLEDFGFNDLKSYDERAKRDLTYYLELMSR